MSFETLMKKKVIAEKLIKFCEDEKLKLEDLYYPLAVALTEKYEAILYTKLYDDENANERYDNMSINARILAEDVHKKAIKNYKPELKEEIIAMYAMIASYLIENNK